MSRTGIREPTSRNSLAFGLLLAVMAALTLSHATNVHAAPGDLDTNFGGDGKLTTSFGPGNDGAEDVVIAGDGKFLVAGYTHNTKGNGTVDFALARYKADGSPDTTFGQDLNGDGVKDGRLITAVGAGDDHAHALAVQADGRIVVAGSSGGDAALVRYNPDGTLDATFDGDGIVKTDFGSSSEVANAIGIQADGKLVIAGSSGNDFALARYNPDGTPDTSSDADPGVHFGTDGEVTTDFGSLGDAANALAIQPDGKFVAAGYSFPNVSAKRAFALARYNPDGSLDPTFGSGGKRTTEFGNQASVQAVVVGDDGSIFAAGYSADEVAGDFALARYDEGGNPVSSFGSFGKVETNFVDDGNFGSDDVALDLAIQSDDKLVVAGYTNADFALARYAPTGALNATFGQDGKATTDFGSGDRAAALALQADARILAAGASGSDFALARYYGGSDDTAPKAQPPAQILLAGSTLGDPTVPVRLRWSATDHPGGSGIASYQLQRSTNGSPYATVSLPSAKATAVTPSLHPGKTYRFRVRALDETGNRSAWSYGPRFRVDASQERDGAVSYAGAWKPERLASAYGGAVKYATESGAWARLAFRGGSIAWVAPKGPNRGRAEVRLDGRKVATVDLYSQGARPRRVVFARNGLNPSVPHVLEVKALGTKRAASSGTRVEVDALVVVRRSGGG